MLGSPLQQRRWHRCCHEGIQPLQLKLLPPSKRLLLLLLSQPIKSRDELLHSLILSDSHMVIIITRLLRWDDDVAWDVQDTISRNAVTDVNVVVSIDADIAETVEVRNIDRQTLALEKRLHIQMNRTHVVVWHIMMRHIVVLPLLLVPLLTHLIHMRIILIRVQRLVRNDMVLQEHLQILLAALREEESVHNVWKTSPGTVVWREECEALVWESTELLVKTSLHHS